MITSLIKKKYSRYTICKCNLRLRTTQIRTHCNNLISLIIQSQSEFTISINSKQQQTTTKRCAITPRMHALWNACWLLLFILSRNISDKQDTLESLSSFHFQRNKIHTWSKLNIYYNILTMNTEDFKWPDVSKLRHNISNVCIILLS